MTLIERIQNVFRSGKQPVTTQVAPVLSAIPSTSAVQATVQPDVLIADVPYVVEPLPHWIADEDALRDEGVLFGLSEAGPEEKVAVIRYHFAQQTAPVEQEIERYTEKIGELNLLIEQKGTRINDLRQQLDKLRTRSFVETYLPRTLIGLCLSIVMCIGTFFLIDDTLQPTFPNNRWIAVGVYLTGMFGLFNRTSVFHDAGARLSGRRLLEEIGLPLATSLFVLAQAWSTRPVWSALALFVFVFFVFLLAGKLTLGLFTVLGNDLAGLQTNRQLRRDREQQVPVLEASLHQLTQETDTIRAQKWPLVTALNRTEAEVTRLNARRDQLVNLFISEFELARSLRDRLTERQRAEILTR
ncbi:hypothetical protein [Fibrisoma limi]|nr:hypothetical protein [Fibrisoma limi]